MLSKLRGKGSGRDPNQPGRRRFKNRLRSSKGSVATDYYSADEMSLPGTSPRVSISNGGHHARGASAWPEDGPIEEAAEEGDVGGAAQRKLLSGRGSTSRGGSRKRLLAAAERIRAGSSFKRKPPDVRWVLKWRWGLLVVALHRLCWVCLPAG